ncbi:MAG: CDP-glucose 4,6-dehydratase [Saccharofermentans sp.]|nr:CDP-glucose 4,6-dehydratase [Saccharofermentans sp.]
MLRGRSGKTDMRDFSWYKGKKVLVTGHTGFKGTWLTRMLVNSGAVVTGYSLTPPTDPALFDMAGLEGKIDSVIGDVRDMEHMLEVFTSFQPEIVLHLAAQPIVRDSYKEPRYTYETNVMGTVNLLECVRLTPSVKSVVNVTTDKVYLNEERQEGYKEDEKLDGFDPYSNSKSCSELVTHSYKRSFFTPDMEKGVRTVAVSTARAGNVIGGGDFANDRIVPDCVRAVKAGKTLEVRNPYSVRPYQHVLEPLAIYLTIAKAQEEDPSLQGYYNVGPDDEDCVTTGTLADLFAASWGEGFAWENKSEANAPHEAGFLRLNCDKIKKVFGWKATWNISEAINKTVEFSKVYLAGGDIPSEMDRQINEFLKEANYG